MTMGVGINVVIIDLFLHAVEIQTILGSLLEHSYLGPILLIVFLPITAAFWEDVEPGQKVVRGFVTDNTVANRMGF